MKLGRLSLLIIVLLSSLSIAAQNRQSVDVSGKVLEEGTKEAIEQATVRLLSVNDSTLLGGVVSERNGAFTLKGIAPGEYLLHISYVGYEPLYQPLQITGRTNPVQLGDLALADGTIMLGAAVVTGKAPEVSFRNDTLEFNAESFKVPEGSVLLDLLKKMPGVEVDSEGKIKVNGKEIQKILVDGKEFFSSDPQVATKNLPSNMIDKVQVLDRLSEMSQLTGFNDGDEETVINLTVRPGMKQGWIGNINAGYGNKDRYEASGMVSRLYNNDQLSILGGLNNTNSMGGGMGGGRGGGGGFGGGQNGITEASNAGLNFSKELSALTTLGGNGRYSHSDNTTTSKQTMERYQNEGSSQFEYSNSFNNNVRDNFGSDLRFDWKPDSKTTLIFRPNFSYSKTESLSTSDGHAADAATDTTIYNSDSYSYSKGDSYSLSGRLEFSKRLNDDGRIFSFSLNGGLSDSDSDVDNISNTIYASGREELRDQKIKNENTGFNYRAYVSWVEPLPIGENNFMQLTYSFSQNKQEQLKNAYNQDEYGNYTVIDTAQTQNTRNDYINQRISLSFKSVRAKFNYTIGFNVDPTYSRTERFIGDTILSTIKQNVVNFSPTAQFRFNFNQRTNLRIDYDGRTNQPSMTQLQPVPNYTNPTNTVVGNPDLKPSYTNTMNVRYQFFLPESQSALMISAGGNYGINDIVNYIIYSNEERGKRTTTYENLSGNYSGNLRLMFNSPFKNKKFTVNSTSSASYSKTASYVGNELEDGSVTRSKSANNSLNLTERLGFDFRSSYFDMGVNGSINYRKADFSLSPDQNTETFDFSVGGTTTIYLPYNFNIESDISWNTNKGYDDSYKLDEVLWNASLSKSFLKGNAATLRLKMYDILQQRSNISYSSNSSGYSYTQYNTINSYFMVSFIYRFNIFSGGAGIQDMFGRGGRGGGGEGPGAGGPPPGGGGRPAGGGGMPPGGGRF
ncbi:outer membrane beta-barrel protein [Parabacteroides sp. OttesenSCG-928-G07]|nr:outer membrane beta-barrel protein [Parabacteroides sp. OttesenSCG-928-G07]